MPIELPFNSYFNGSISYLNNKTNDISSLIKTKASSMSQNSYCIIDPEKCKNSFQTLISPNISSQWIQIEFKKGIIFASSYSLLSTKNPEGSNFHQKGWKLIASIDGRFWEEIDRRENVSSLNGWAKYDNFKCKQGLYRIFRIVQTEKGFTDEWGFGLRRIEIFGTFYETNYVPRKIACTNKQQRTTSNLIFLICFAFNHS